MTPKSATPGRDRDRTSVYRRRLSPVLLVAAGLVAYLNCFPGVFVFDDNPHIVGNETIRSLSPLGDILASRRPVVTLTLAINYAIDGLNVRGYHALNLAVHLLAALTLYGVVCRTLLRMSPSQRHGCSRTWLAVTVASIWVVHPLHTQSVTYVIQRAESLMGFFFMLTLYCVIRGAESVRRRYWYATAVIACGLGMGSKAVMVTAPVMILVYDCVFISKSVFEALRQRWHLYLSLAATWGILFAGGVVRGVLNPSHTGRATVGFGFRGITPLEYLVTQPGVIMHYLTLSFWPQELCLDYGWPVARTAGAVLGPTLLIAMLFVGSLWALCRRRWIGFAGTWFFLILAPTSSFIPIKDPMYEHRMYLPLAAVVVLAVTGGNACIEYLSRRVSLDLSIKRLVTTGLVLTIVGALGYRTVRRNQDYHSRIAMWRAVVSTRPEYARGHCNLGQALADAGKRGEAIGAFHHALRIDPVFAEAHHNLGVALADSGRTDEAVEPLRSAVRINPAFVEARQKLGVVLMRLRRIDEAIQSFRTVLEIRPAYLDAHNNLGVALGMRGEIDEAIRVLRRALRIDPTFAAAHFNLGHALLKQDKIDEAVKEYQETLRIMPDHAGARKALEVALGKP